MRALQSAPKEPVTAPVAPEDRNVQEPDRFRAPWKIFWVALAVRVLYITIAHTYRIRPIEDHFQFGWELGRIARALATGYGYSDPFIGHTGPTAWIPPLYTLMVAGIFKLFGVYSQISAWVVLACNSVFSAATALAVYEIAARCYNRRVALWSAWLWALYPAAMQYAVRWIWEMTLTTMLFAFVLVLALRMRGVGEARTDNARTGNARAGKENTGKQNTGEQNTGKERAGKEHQTASRWAMFGLLWGLIVLSSPTPILFLPVCGVWILMGAENKMRAIRNAVLAAIVFCACVAPWAERNWIVFHAFIPTRGNLGAEMYMGNGPGSNGFPWGPTIPLSRLDPQLRDYVRLGEVGYVRRMGKMATAYIREHRARFAKMSLLRFYMFWAGVPHPPEPSRLVEYVRMLNFSFTSVAGLMGLWLSMRKRAPAAGLFAWAFLLIPLTYYFVTVQARFRHPLEPLIAIFAVYLFQSAQIQSAQFQSAHPSSGAPQIEGAAGA